MPRPDVSDHAIVRYMERGLGIDINLLKNEIAPASMAKPHHLLGDGKYPISHHCHAVVHNNVIVTVIGGAK